MRLTYDTQSMTLSSIKRVQVNQTIIELIEGDITRQDTEAIVNAANSSLLGGGGVDGAIHRAAGPELLVETRTLNGCRTGDAKITGGYKLKAKYVIHAVGPIYQRQSPIVPQMLASAYRRSLEVAQANGIHSIAFPSLSTGTYGYPLEEAAPIALKTVVDFVVQQENIKEVRFILFNQQTLEYFVRALAELLRKDHDRIKVM